MTYRAIVKAITGDLLGGVVSAESPGLDKTGAETWGRTFFLANVAGGKNPAEPYIVSKRGGYWLAIYPVSCGAILFGNREGKYVLDTVGYGGYTRLELFNYMRKHGVLPEGYTLLAQIRGGIITPIPYELINWGTIGEIAPSAPRNQTESRQGEGTCA